MTQTRLAIFASGLLAIVACGDDGGSGHTQMDAPAVAADAPPLPLDASNIDAAPAPAMITITGTAVTRSASGSMPVANATIAGYRTGDDQNPLAITTTNAQGEFSLIVDTGGLALEGYLKATAPQLIDTYLYPPGPLVQDISAPINMVSESVRDLLFLLAGVTRQSGSGLVAMIVVDGATATSQPIAGATVSSTPAAGAYRYNNPATGLPGGATITSTHTDGLGYLMNLPGDANVTVSATRAGTTFASHNIKAWSDRLTTTLVVPAP